MCAAVPVALLLLVIFAALTVLRLGGDAPNARLLASLLDDLDRDSADSPDPTVTTPHLREGGSGAA